MISNFVLKPTLIQVARRLYQRLKDTGWCEEDFLETYLLGMCDLIAAVSHPNDGDSLEAISDQIRAEILTALEGA